MCAAGAHLAPALAELDRGHLQRFSVTWDIAVKRVYQDVVYSDALVQNNLPIFVSQLRSLFPDKEHEARYTKLVRGYLDFDVDMENVRDFWKAAAAAMAEHVREQGRLREKQRALKAEWERFKVWIYSI